MRVFPLLILAYMVGCTSTKPLADQTFTQESLIEQLDTKSQITVKKKDGEEYRFLKVNAIEKEYLLCNNKKYENLIIYYSTIQRIEIINWPTTDTEKTIITIGVISVAILFVALIGVLSNGGIF